MSVKGTLLTLGKSEYSDKIRNKTFCGAVSALSVDIFEF